MALPLLMSVNWKIHIYYCLVWWCSVLRISLSPRGTFLRTEQANGTGATPLYSATALPPVSSALSFWHKFIQMIICHRCLFTDTIRCIKKMFEKECACSLRGRGAERRGGRTGLSKTIRSVSRSDGAGKGTRVSQKQDRKTGVSFRGKDCTDQEE